MKNNLFGFHNTLLQPFSCENPNIHKLLKQKNSKSSESNADKIKNSTEDTLKSLLKTISCFRDLSKANTKFNEKSEAISKEFSKLKKLLKKHYLRGK